MYWGNMPKPRPDAPSLDRASPRWSDDSRTQRVDLPHAVIPEALRELIGRRASCRRFSEEPLRLEHLTVLLEASYGIAGSASVDSAAFSHRPVPSAGACYPLHLYVIARAVVGVEPGVYIYEPAARCIWYVGPRPPDDHVTTVFFNQTYVGHAAVVAVIAANYERTMQRYGDRGYRYVLFEAGHVAQNVALCAAAMGIGNLNIGGFQDAELAHMMQVTGRGVFPLYGIALGYPSVDDIATARIAEND